MNPSPDSAPRPYRAQRFCTSVYIVGEDMFLEVDYMSFPKFTGSHLSYSSLVPWQRQRSDEALQKAQALAETLEPGTPEEEILKRYRKLSN